jgi:hypothetical protein
MYYMFLPADKIKIKKKGKRCWVHTAQHSEAHMSRRFPSGTGPPFVGGPRGPPLIGSPPREAFMALAWSALTLTVFHDTRHQQGKNISI